MATDRRCFALSALALGAAFAGAAPVAAAYDPEKPSDPGRLALITGQTDLFTEGGRHIQTLNWTAPSWSFGQRWPMFAGKRGLMAGTFNTASLIVLHETAVSNDKYVHPAFTGIHFLVLRDGSVVQPAPLTRRFQHAPEVKRSIGIEISNGEGGRNYTNATGSDRVKATWRGKLGRFLLIPTRAQLASVAALVRVLSHEFSLPNRALNAEVLPDLFLLSSQGQALGRGLDSKVGTFAGIMSHSIMPAGPDGRGDGGVAALYVWLRMAHHLSDEEAYCVILDRAQTSPTAFKDVAASPAKSALSGGLVDTWSTFVTPQVLNDDCRGGSPTF
jgi:hypothetical protein